MPRRRAGPSSACRTTGRRSSDRPVRPGAGHPAGARCRRPERGTLPTPAPDKSHRRLRLRRRERIGENMAIGPVQLIVLGFPDPDFHGEIIDELERLRESDTVRVIDALAVYKDADGDIEAMHLSNLSRDEAIELGSKVGALIGLGFDGEEGAEAGAAAGARAAADGIAPFPEDDAWDVLEDIPNGTAAAVVLIEHHWAVGLRDAVARAGGYRVSDGFISPLDLIALGMVTAEEAAALHGVETAALPT